MNTQIQEIENEIYKKLNISDSRKRRSILINEMKQLQLHQIGCLNCSGQCCSWQSNSMKITPLETFELLLAFKSQDLNTIQEKLKKTISEFRLDREIYTGKKQSSTLRKTYSCPFYTLGSKGCSISLEHKPYGCLSFNPKSIDDNGSTCGLNEELFLRREHEYLKEERDANQYLKDKLKLDWDKLEIPRAIMSMVERLEKSISVT